MKFTEFFSSHGSLAQLLRDVAQCLTEVRALPAIVEGHPDVAEGIRLVLSRVMRKMDSPEKTGVGFWCGPGPAETQERRFLLVYEDADRPNLVVGSEDDAYAVFARAEGRGYNSHLFGSMPRRRPAEARPDAKDPS